jgi:23S rRNA pseudouridine955/2504/2580 synthase
VVSARPTYAILYRDDTLLAVDKAPGVLTVAAPGSRERCLLDDMRRDGHKVAPVHRLDRDTSGVLLLAKSRKALLRAQSAFRDGKAQKRYRALLCGPWLGGSRDVDSALLKNRLASGERFVLVDDQGKPSRSRFTPVARYSQATLCEVDIFSGRMHQIRVHAADIGHPVAGDRKYGQADDKRPLRDLGLRRTFLHAFSLRLPAIGEFPAVTIESPLPEELESFLPKLGPAK